MRGYHQQEVFGEAVVSAIDEGGRVGHRVVLELVAGGKNLRTETGEVCVAVETEDGRSFVVPGPVGQQTESHPVAAGLPLFFGLLSPEVS